MASANIKRAVAPISTSKIERYVKEKLQKAVRRLLGINWCLLSFVAGIGCVEKGQLNLSQTYCRRSLRRFPGRFSGDFLDRPAGLGFIGFQTGACANELPFFTFGEVQHSLIQ